MEGAAGRKPAFNMKMSGFPEEYRTFVTGLVILVFAADHNAAIDRGSHIDIRVGCFPNQRARRP